MPALARTAFPSGERISSSLDPIPPSRYSIPLMREQVILECTEARAEGKPPSRYFGTRNKKLKKDRIELRKFNHFLRRYTLHREKK